jgi:histidyl-tRNA synthetase
MEQRGLFPQRLAGEPQVLVTQFSAETLQPSLRIAQQLRQSGLRVDVYPEFGKYGKQFKYADQRRIPYAILLGPQELEAGLAAVKDLRTGEQISIPYDSVVQWLKDRIAS